MQVSWWVELAVRPGCLDGFAKLTGEMVSSAQAENGVLAYQRFISEDR
jgi:quinol monooxygenase YgiN